MSSVLGVGVIGCGNISATYFRNVPIFKNIKVVACADINPSSSYDSSKEFGVTALSVEEILNDEDIDILVNLTIPSAHFSVSKSILEAGKHVYTEKPLAISLEEAHPLKTISEKNGLMIAAAPDTFLGGAHQHARYLVDSGDLGNIIGGSCNFMNHGMEHWHPNPDFFFKPGAGPVFDVGVYYITQLVNLIGPVKQINAISGTATNERTITSQPRYGDKIKVETPTTLMGSLGFQNGAKVQFFCTWDVWKNNHSTIDLYGLDGSMIVPDPNFFSGDLLISQKDSDWGTINNDKMLLGIPNKSDGEGNKKANYRGIGLSEMIDSIAKNRKARCSLELSLHVLEIMDGIIKSAEEKTSYILTTNPEQPDLLTEEEISKLKI